MSSPVLVLGSIAIDNIHTPTESRENLLGGSASFAAVAASFHAPVNLLGIVGTDFPKEHRGLFEERKIGLDGLEVAEGKTFRWTGRYEENMNNRTTLSVELNVFEHYAPRLPASYAKTPYVLLANIAPELQLTVLYQIQKPQFVIADTMDLWIRTAQPQLLQLLERIDLLILNDSEASLLSGETNLLRAARWLHAQGPRYVAIKKGEHGCLLLGAEGAFIAPAFLLETVADPTGAGDAFAGGLAGYLSQTKSENFENLKRGVLEGTLLASFAVEDFSLNRLGRLTEAELHERRKMLARLMTV